MNYVKLKFEVTFFINYFIISFYNFIYIYIYIYIYNTHIENSRNLSAKYYQENKGRLQRKNL